MRESNSRAVGISLDAALNRVAKEIGAAHPTLGENYAIVAAELRSGQTREVALRNLAHRVGLEEVLSLVNFLVQSENLGSSIAQSLRVKAQELRTMRMMRAERKANVLPVKLTVPLALCIFPALFIAILTPAVIGVIRVLLPSLNGDTVG